MLVSRCLCGWFGAEEIENCPQCGTNFDLLTEFWKEFTKAKGIEPVSDVAPSEELEKEIRDAWERFLRCRRIEQRIEERERENASLAFEICAHCLEHRPCLKFRYPVQTSYCTPLDKVEETGPTFAFINTTLCGNCINETNRTNARDGHRDLVLDAFIYGY
jgi:hypothetical protein